VAAGQGAYFLVTGLWSIVSRPTFEAVTGPKEDYWLVRTVGVLTSAIGGSLITAARRDRVPAELAGLAAASALGLAAIDVYYVSVGRISRVYLADAAVELAIVSAWEHA
jgi:hypothetical protein